MTKMELKEESFCRLVEMSLPHKCILGYYFQQQHQQHSVDETWSRVCFNWIKRCSNFFRQKNHILFVLHIVIILHLGNKIYIKQTSSKSNQQGELMPLGTFGQPDPFHSPVHFATGEQTQHSVQAEMKLLLKAISNRLKSISSNAPL